MRVSVFGLGYVGCVTASCVSRAGHEVIGVDIDAEKVAAVNAGTPPVVEPGLGELLAELVGAHRLRATVSAAEAVRQTDVGLICVGTPGRANGQLGVAALERIGQEIGQALAGRTEPYTVVLRSTVLPGTTERVLIPALRAGAGRELACQLRVAVNPEFMREGSSLRDFAHPPFTLVGSDDAETASVLRALYADVAAPFVHTAVRTAEMVKYVSNAFHALKVCFANEIGDLCAALGADTHEVMRIFLMDRKLNVSQAYLRPGFAFGGSCLPKDLRALLYAARTADVSPQVVSAILPSNEAQLRGGVDRLVEALIGKGCCVRIRDPSVSLAQLVGANRRYIEEEIPHIASLMCEDIQQLLDHAEVLVIGSASREAAHALAAIGPEHIVVDLT